MSTTVHFPADHTAAEWREKAADRLRSSAESWERSDTDGALSQWADDTMAHLYQACAKVVEDGGTVWFRVLADLDGNVIEDAREVETRYGYAWVVPQQDGSVKWFNESGARKAKTRVANNAKKGYKFMKVRREAVMVLGSGWRPLPVALPKDGSPVVEVADWDEQDF